MSKMETLRKQIERDSQNLHIYAQRKKQIRREIIFSVLIIILWITALIALVGIKWKLEEPRDTYVVVGTVEKRTDTGYYIVLKSNGKRKFYETEDKFPKGSLVTVEMNGNKTLEESDDFIEYVY